MTRTHQQRQTTAPHRPTGADRAQRPHERTRIIHACAEAVITHGYGAVTMSLVQHESGLARDQLYRLFRNKNELLTELYRRGHHRVSSPCRPAPRQSSKHHESMTSDPSLARTFDTGADSLRTVIDGVRQFATAVIESAASDPVVKAAHALEMSPVAPATGLPSIYRVWEQWLVEVLGTDPLRANTLPSAAESVGDTWTAEASGIAGAVVDALAGIIARARRDDISGNQTATRSVDLMLQSLIPGLHLKRGAEISELP
ncbi:hypothetical protein CH263_19945 [Rhodococcus sp. 06-1059B-a]|nr:TetR/AcrR family transcriptional regulator [Rhodococcus sp. 06-1059B-a]OZD60771.1 hypothetical protein CH263_19945 [Rhodococcus sp. 06-1059B-a]